MALSSEMRASPWCADIHVKRIDLKRETTKRNCRFMEVRNKEDENAWLEGIKAGDDDAWREVWENVIVPETSSQKNFEIMEKHSITAGDLMGMLFEDMIHRQKIELYHNDGSSLKSWLRCYVKGYILNSSPYKHGEISIYTQVQGEEDDQEGMLPEISTEDNNVLMKEIWEMTHYCFKDLWNQSPQKAYVLLLKTRFHLSSDEIRDFLDISSSANVDQIFSRAIKFMRNAWKKRENPQK